MRFHGHDRGHACDCAAHRAPGSPKEARGGLWELWLPVLVCAVCPACLATYAKLLSVVGVGLGLSEFQHGVLLTLAIAASVLVSAWRSWRSQRVWPVLVALAGSSLLSLGHFAGELHFLEWAGVGLLLAGGLTEQFRLKRRLRVVQALEAPVSLVRASRS